MGKWGEKRVGGSGATVVRRLRFGVVEDLGGGTVVL
jgi:hypothetical protein